MFWSDNGLHVGQHRLPPAKGSPYVEDVWTPMVVRGPGVAAGRKSHDLLLNTDLAPTFADLAGAGENVPGFVDGRSFAPLLGADAPQGTWRDAVLLETRGFEAVLTVDSSYVEYGTGERELYDLAADPYQLRSLCNDPAHAGKKAALAARLDALRNCAGESCRSDEGP